MSNQKLNYRKILTSERLPEKEGKYLCKIKDKYLFCHQIFNNHEVFIKEWNDGVEYWLEPFESREEELADLLEEALNLLDDFPYEQSLQERRANLNMNAQNTIWEIKNNAPNLLDDE